MKRILIGAITLSISLGLLVTVLYGVGHVATPLMLRILPVHVAAGMSVDQVGLFSLLLILMTIGFIWGLALVLYVMGAYVEDQILPKLKNYVHPNKEEI